MYRDLFERVTDTSDDGYRGTNSAAWELLTMCNCVLAIVAPTNSDTGDHERAEIDTVKSHFVSVLPSSIDDPFLYDVDTANFRMK